MGGARLGLASGMFPSPVKGETGCPEGQGRESVVFRYVHTRISSWVNIRLLSSQPWDGAAPDVPSAPPATERRTLLPLTEGRGRGARMAAGSGAGGSLPHTPTPTAVAARCHCPKANRGVSDPS